MIFSFWGKHHVLNLREPDQGRVPDRMQGLAAEPSVRWCKQLCVLWGSPSSRFPPTYAQSRQVLGPPGARLPHTHLAGLGVAVCGAALLVMLPVNPVSVVPHTLVGAH
jgi:hypothetical protein